MKIAISVPDKTFKAAEKLAKKMKLPRSKLYAIAIERMLAADEEAELITKLNKIYSEVDTTPDEFTREVARRVLERSEW